MRVDLFDIPVYRIRESQYKQELSQYLERHIGSPEMQKFIESNPKWEIAHKEELVKSYGGQWEFNEIIGYIKLYILGAQIRGEYYQKDVKKIRRRSKGVIKLKSYNLVMEKELPFCGSNLEIYAVILNYLNDCQKYLKKQYIDTQVFKTVGSFVDWKSLLGWK